MYISGWAVEAQRPNFSHCHSIHFKTVFRLTYPIISHSLVCGTYISYFVATNTIHPNGSFQVCGRLKIITWDISKTYYCNIYLQFTSNLPDQILGKFHKRKVCLRR